MDIEDLIKQLPKAELHIHIEGTLEPELMFKLAKRNKMTLPFHSIEDIKAAYHFSNLQDFLDIYYQGAAVLQTEEDFYDLAMAYFERAKNDNIRHAEIFFDPQTHLERGIPFATVIHGLNQALVDANEKYHLSGSLIMCFLRHLSEEDAIKTLKLANPFISLIKGVGLDSSEVGNPPEKFQQVFRLAVKQGLLPVAHAGEEGPPDYVYQALDLLKVKRIDHGVRSIEDDVLVARLVREQIPLTVCPLSNIKLRVFDTLKEHSLKVLLSKGVRVMLNSDDPAYFGGYLNENYLQTQKALDLSAEQLVTLAKNSFSSAFISNEEKEHYYKAIDEVYEQFHSYD